MSHDHAIELTITGMPGTGKTRLLYSLGQHLLAQGFNVSCYDEPTRGLPHEAVPAQDLHNAVADTPPQPWPVLVRVLVPSGAATPPKDSSQQGAQP